MEQSEELRRQLALASPGGLAWYTSRGRWRLAPHLSVLNRYLLLLAASRRAGPGKGIDRLIIDMPPRHGKSELVSKHFPSWWMSTFCDRVMLASYEASFAASWGAKNRDLMREHGDMLNLRLVGSQMANNFEVARPSDLSFRGGMMTAGVGGGFTGKGAQLLIIDDPLKNAEEANSITMRTKAVDWWESTAQTRLEPGGVAVLIMTRWHEDDLAGHLLADLNETGDKWTLLSFPAIAETEEDFFNGLYRRSPGEALWPSRYPLERLLRLKGGMASYWWNCTPAETPIMMSDWTEKPISEVQPGDEVAGYTLGDATERLRYTKSKVKHVFSKDEEVFELTMASGRIVRCTADHRWFTGRSATDRRAHYAPAAAGRKLMRMAESGETTDHPSDWAYLAAMTDGEGNVGLQSLTLAQSPQHNPGVTAEIEKILADLDLPHKVRDSMHAGPRSEELRQGRVWVLTGIRDLYKRMIRLCPRLGKRQQMIDALWARPHQPIQEKDEVLSMRSLGVQKVYALETETGNYVAWGYASSNSLYQQHPQPAEGGLFKREDLLYYSQAWRNEPDKSVATFVLHRKTGDQIFDKSECRWFLTVDLAASLKETADYTVIGTWAVTPTNDLLLESVVRKRMEGPDQLNAIIEIWNKTQPDYVGVEAVAYQLTAVQNLRRLGIPTRELEADKDKYSRAITASVLTEGGKFFMAKGAAWVTDFEQELLTFPKGAHDDQVDVFSYAAEQITMHSGLGVYLP